MAVAQPAPSCWAGELGASPAAHSALAWYPRVVSVPNAPGGASPSGCLTRLHAAGCSATFLPAGQEDGLGKRKQQSLRNAIHC